MQVVTEFDSSILTQLRGQNEFFWLDLIDPGAEELAKLGELLELHPLAVETLTRSNQRPKLDDYQGYVVMVFYGASRSVETTPALLETHFVIGDGYIVTVHHGTSTELEAARKLLMSLPKSDEEFTLYRILDTLADSFFPVLDILDNEIDRLENELATEAKSDSLQDLFALKRNLVLMRKIVSPQRDLLAHAIDRIESIPGFDGDLSNYFRNTYDHMLRVSDLIDSYRDLLTSMLDVYLSTVSNRLNTVMERLTLIATVFLPLTFVTGFFGQNFGWMIGHIDGFAAFLLLGIGGVLTPIVGLLIFFKRRGYL